MVKWYMYRIRASKMTLDDVPMKWHDDVAKALEAE